MGAGPRILLKQWHLTHLSGLCVLWLLACWKHNALVATACVLGMMRIQHAISCSQAEMAGRQLTGMQMLRTLFALLCQVEFVIHMTWLSDYLRVTLVYALFMFDVLYRAFPSFVVFKQSVRRKLVEYFDTVPE